MYLCKINNYEPNILLKIFKILTDYEVLLTNRNTKSHLSVDIKELSLKPHQKDIIIKKICQVNYIEKLYIRIVYWKIDKHFELPMISHFEVNCINFSAYFDN